ncbi:hypothetical protein BH24ACT10_BH24ACT10_02490 [soil metagenome]
MAEQVAAGKALALGMSEVSVEELERAAAVHPVASVQSELSLWTRDALADVVPWCAAHGAGFLAFSPLGRGFLTGTVGAGSFDQGDFRARNPRFTGEAMAANAALVDVVRHVADGVGATPAQVALAWVLAQGGHVVPIPGTKKLGYLEQNAASVTLDLSAQDLAQLDALPPATGARYYHTTTTPGSSVPGSSVPSVARAAAMAASVSVLTSSSPPATKSTSRLSSAPR